MEKMSLSLPSGIILPFAGTAEPAGFLLCDGRSLSRAAYPGLFATIGTSHGAPDANTFNIPDYRGRFLRGFDGVAGVDPDKAARTAMKAGGATGNAVGSVQGHAYQTHTHTQNAHQHHMFNYSAAITGVSEQGAPNLNGSQYVAGSTYNVGGVYSTYRMWASSGNNAADVGLTSLITATNQNAAATGANSQASANETRPTNAYVNYIIKV